MSPRRGRVNVLLDGEPPPAGATERFVEILRDNDDRMWLVGIRNRRNGRIQCGTASVWRWRRIVEAVKRRHRDAVISPRGREPIVIRRRRAGAIVATCEPLPGPIRRLTN